jgi:hypothetical protein
MKKLFLNTVLALTLLSFFSFNFSLTAHAENEDITEAGDYLQIILPAIAGLSTFVAGNPEGGLWDREGTYQAIKSIGFSVATQGVTKRVFNKVRPDASDTYSYPSGHTTGAFAGPDLLTSAMDTCGEFQPFWRQDLLPTAGFNHITTLRMIRSQAPASD